MTGFGAPDAVALDGAAAIAKAHCAGTHARRANPSPDHPAALALGALHAARVAAGWLAVAGRRAPGFADISVQGSGVLNGAWRRVRDRAA